jgi:hypothetical protein
MLIFLLSIAGLIFFSARLLYYIFPESGRKKIAAFKKKLTPLEAQHSEQLIIDHLQKFPDSEVRFDFPYLYDVAVATNRYNELNSQVKNGEIDEITYECELEKILPYIKLNC